MSRTLAILPILALALLASEPAALAQVKGGSTKKAESGGGSTSMYVDVTVGSVSPATADLATEVNTPVSCTLLFDVEAPSLLSGPFYLWTLNEVLYSASGTPTDSADDGYCAYFDSPECDSANLVAIFYVAGNYRLGSRVDAFGSTVVDWDGYTEDEEALAGLQWSYGTGSCDPVAVGDQPTAQNLLDGAIARFKKWPEAAKLFDDTSKNLFDGKLKIILGTDNDWSFSATWADKANPAIVINPNGPAGNDIFRLVCGILFETLNASKKVDFEKADDDALSGTLNRIDYVVRFEEIEYNNFKEHHRIATEGSDPKNPNRAWFSPAKVDCYDNLAAYSFSNYLVFQAGTSPPHMIGYATFWNDYCKDTWHNIHGDGGEDDCSSAISADAIKALKVVFGSS